MAPRVSVSLRLQTQTQTLTLDARKRRKPVFGKPHAQPLQLEIAFARRIDLIFDRLAVKAISIASAQARRLTLDAPSPADDRELRRGLEREVDFSERDGSALVRDVGRHNARQMRRALKVKLKVKRPKDKSKSIALKIPELSQANVRSMAKRTVREVKHISSRMATKVQAAVTRSISKGLRGEALATQLMGLMKIERKAAKRIAVGQVIRINSEITEQRHVALGISKYKWRAIDDQWTRAWHWQLNNTIQSYDDPPMGGGAGPKDRGHAGSADVCRCQQLPVIE